MNLDDIETALDCTLDRGYPSSLQLVNVRLGHGFRLPEVIVIGNRARTIYFIWPAIDLRWNVSPYKRTAIHETIEQPTSSVAKSPEDSQGATVLAFRPAWLS